MNISSHPFHSRVGGAVALACVVALAACGGDDDEKGRGAGAGKTATPRERELDAATVRDCFQKKLGAGLVETADLEKDYFFGELATGGQMAGTTKLALRFDKEPQNYGAPGSGTGADGIADDEDKALETGPASVFVFPDSAEAITGEADYTQFVDEHGDLAISGFSERRDNVLIIFFTPEAHGPSKTAARQGKLVQACVGGEVQAPAG